MDHAHTSVILVSWNRLAETRACLHSLEAIRREWTKCIVVDNGSVDGSRQALPREFPWIQFIDAGSNLGYAGGNNRGIRSALASGSESMLVLNNDTLVRPGLVREMRSALEADPRLGVVGALVYRRDGSTGFWYGGGRILRSPFRARAIVEKPTSDQPYPVDYVPGCALFTSRAVIEKTGGFDERFFLTWEDADFCVRLRQVGLDCAIVPSAAVEHHGSASFEGLFSPLYSYYYFRNMLFFAQLHFPRSDRPAAYRDVLGLARATIRAAPSTGARWRLATAILLGLLHFASRRFGEAPSRLTRTALEARHAAPPRP